MIDNYPLVQILAWEMIQLYDPIINKHGASTFFSNALLQQQCGFTSPKCAPLNFFKTGIGIGSRNTELEPGYSQRSCRWLMATGNEKTYVCFRTSLLSWDLAPNNGGLVSSCLLKVFPFYDCDQSAMLRSNQNAKMVPGCSKVRCRRQDPGYPGSKSSAKGSETARLLRNPTSE